VKKILYSNLRITDYYETYRMAVHMFIEVEGVNAYSPSEWIDYHGINYIEKIIKPCRWTLLHEYIYDTYHSEFSYLLDKHFPREVIDALIEVFENYEYNNDELVKLNNRYHKYCEENEYDGAGDMDKEIDNLADDYIDLFENELMSLVVDDIFNVLFQNKTFLRNFNMDIAKLIHELKIEEYPEYLKKEGVVNRCTYLPQWMKRGVFYRDKGRCQICGKDLTGLLKPNNDKNFDHIIPLERGGSNDPTNFQLTCESCNSKKGDRNCDTKDIVIPFWELEE